MLPVAGGGHLPGGLLGFAKRRARRILPPYYAALVIVLGILFASHHLVKHGSEGLADMSVGNIASHFLLIHNLFSKYNMALDGPMWSVAWEWQIYFIFALILLPVWRRFGILWTVALGFTIGILPQMLLPAQTNLSWTSPWYVGLFSLGMAVAVVARSQSGQYGPLKNAVFLNRITGSIAVIFLTLVLLKPQWLDARNYWLIDTFIGAFAAVFILACTNNHASSWFHKTIVTGLQAPTMMKLGAFSYSLYLLHYPILQKIHDVLRQHHISHYMQLVVLLLVGIPVCLCTAYAFHIVFERPFMPGQPKSLRQAEVAAIISPAP